MIKTKFKGYKLHNLRLFEADVARETDQWRATYIDTVVSGWSGEEVYGYGHTPEEAMEDARKTIQTASKE